MSSKTPTTGRRNATAGKGTTGAAPAAAARAAKKTPAKKTTAARKKAAALLAKHSNGQAVPGKPAPARKLKRQPSEASLRRRMQQMENKRSMILEAALSHFSRFGLHGTSLDQVAREADVSKTNLLYYFSSKEELYVSVLKQLMDVWLYPLESFTAESDPMEAIGDYIRAKLVLSRDYPRESRLFCLEVMQGAPLMIDVLEQRVRLLVEEKSRVIDAWIEQGRMAPCDARHLIFSLWAITQHYADFHVQIVAVTGASLEDPSFFEETLRNVRTLILNGIRPRD